MTDRENQGTVIEIARRIRMDETTAVAVVELCLRQIKKVNPILNAFVEVFEEEALQNASIADAARVSGRELGPLHGVPVALKANLDIKGRLTTSCCAAFRNNRVTSDAACVERLRAAGAIIIGQTNMHELAYGGTGEVSSAGPALNPWDQSRNAGGSSSGSAVAVASGMVPAALGTDTGGSVRIPAAACGLVGFKPTINSISTKGVMPLSWTMDHVGPLTRNVTDALVVASAMAEEGSPLAEGVRVGDRYRGELKPLKVGFGRIPGFEVDASVGEVVNEAMEKMQQYGYMLKPFNLAYTKEAHVSWLSIMYSEASAYYARALEKHYEEFAASVRVQLEAGRHISSVTYLKAQRFRTHYERYFSGKLEEVDVICMPTLPTVAPKVGQTHVRLPSGTVSTQDAMTFSNLTANMLGWPAVTVPIGATPHGLPVGMTLMRGAAQDASLMVDAMELEKVLL